MKRVENAIANPVIQLELFGITVCTVAFGGNKKGVTIFTVTH